jgi:hypothetical protein
VPKIFSEDGEIKAKAFLGPGVALPPLPVTTLPFWIEIAILT